MCRNIRPLYNFEPATTPDEIRNAAVQFVRKVSGMSKPSKANEPAFNKAVDEVSHSIQHLLGSLVPEQGSRGGEGSRAIRGTLRTHRTDIR